MLAINYLVTLSIFLGVIESADIILDVIQYPQYYTPLDESIYVAGSFNNWNPSDNNFKLVKQPNGSYRASFTLPIGTYQYKFTRGSWSSGETSADGSFMANRALQVTTNSYFVQNIIANWDDFKGTHSATGNVRILTNSFPYRQFNTTKRIWIYLPSDYYFATTKRYSVVYMHDGQNLFDNMYSFMGEWGIDEALETFSNQGKETSIVVGVETTMNRMSELTPFSNPQYGGGKADLYLDFLIDDLKPYIDANFRTLSGRESTGITGSSLGGLFSFWAGLKRQDVFSKVGVFSPSFWYSSQIYDFARNTNLQYIDFKMYFVCGGQESQTMASDMNTMVNQLRLQGYGTKLVSYVKADGQHSEWFWRREFPDSYKYHFSI